ncbi:hypothetical protein SLEP1_g17548 [Rubroshorea leprosula]|uniref:Uncharacterized protein n=1 Tax=Rubroshorea leprosula TaxID=152421 RepID=A0AAV5J578_9ROSI|nr:hypothetical protein SLEP1_g17548 [Rubroshorea leprosula]
MLGLNDRNFKVEGLMANILKGLNLWFFHFAHLLPVAATRKRKKKEPSQADSPTWKIEFGSALLCPVAALASCGCKFLEFSPRELLLHLPPASPPAKLGFCSWKIMVCGSFSKCKFYPFSC